MKDEKTAFSIGSAPGSTQAAIQALPVQFTPLIGREQDAAAICVLLQRPEVRLLSLVGTGGVGKTRLAIQVAQQMREHLANGVYFVGLAAISDPALVIPALAKEFGVQETGAFPLFDQLKATLQEKHCLLLLDNFEQLLDAAPLLEELLVACPSLKILVTSRATLHLRAAYSFPVSPLALPDLTYLPESDKLAAYSAVALFIERAQARLPMFQLTQENARAVAELCVHLDGLPLAIELAAARLPLLPPQALLARLSQRFQLLTGGARTLPARQQTLRNTLQWSYDLLTPQEQRLFRRLAVFVGGCTLEAVEAICTTLDGSDEQILDTVATLLDKSLVQQAQQRGEEPRLLMLETLREYGLECLTVSREMESTRRAHADYYLSLAEGVKQQHEGSVWLDRMEREHNNLRAAMQWSLERAEAGQDAGNAQEMALRFGTVLEPFWNVHGHWSEGRAFLEQALAASGGIMTSTRVGALRVAASLAVFQVDASRGEVLCRESLSLYRELGDRAGVAYSLFLLGTLAWQRGDFAAAQSSMEESLALYKDLGVGEGIASLLLCLAELDTQQGNYADAQALFEESLAMSRAMGMDRHTANALRSLALALYISRDDPAMVHSLLAESMALSRALGDKADIARSLSHSALVELQEGNTVRARELAEESMALHRETGDAWGIAWVLSILARVDAQEGWHAAARTRYEESLTAAGKIGSKLIIAFCLEGLASLAATQGEPVRATLLWGAADSVRETMGVPIWPVERATYERAVEGVRAQLGEMAFAAAWAEGRTITPEQALNAREPVTLPQSLPTAPSSTPSVGPAPTYPDGLTTREVEVLRVVAQGFTDAQVAEQLVISPHTVNTHLKSIYGKIGVSSRSAATRYAVEHRLL